MQLTLLDHSGESLLLDTGRSQLDAFQDTWVEDIETGVDSVSNELHRLFDESVDARWVVWLVNNDTVLAGLLDLGDDDGTLITVSLVELSELSEGVFADDIAVQNEERSVILAEDLLSKLEGTSRTERLGLDGEFDVDAIFFLVL